MSVNTVYEEHIIAEKRYVCIPPETARWVPNANKNETKTHEIYMPNTNPTLAYPK